MELLEKSVGCPYCGEKFIALIDLSSGSSAYIEDCQICCQPIQFQLECIDAGELSGLTLRRDDD